MSNEQQARKDALADMMTLSVVASSLFPSTRYFEFYGFDGLVDRVRELLADVESCSDSARASAALAARQAFRICPALRGDR